MLPLSERPQHFGASRKEQIKPLHVASVCPTTHAINLATPSYLDSAQAKPLNKFMMECFAKHALGKPDDKRDKGTNSIPAYSHFPRNFSPSPFLGLNVASSFRPSACCSAGAEPTGAVPAEIWSSRHFSLMSAIRCPGFL